MEIYMDIYSAHLHVRGVLADLCPGNIRIGEATVRLPLSASILIIINDYQSFPTLTPPSVISRRHDSRPKVSYNDGFARTREEWTRMAGMHKLEYLTGSIIETRSVSNQWYAKSTGGSHENIYYCRSPLSIYPLRVIIVPGFVISTGVLTGWNSTLLNFLLFFLVLFLSLLSNISPRERSNHDRLTRLICPEKLCRIDFWDIFRLQVSRSSRKFYRL